MHCFLCVCMTVRLPLLFVITLKARVRQAALRQRAAIAVRSVTLNLRISSQSGSDASSRVNAV
jgi:hypothetical protein